MSLVHIPNYGLSLPLASLRRVETAFLRRMSYDVPVVLDSVFSVTQNQVLEAKSCVIFEFDTEEEAGEIREFLYRKNYGEPEEFDEDSVAKLSKKEAKEAKMAFEAEQESNMEQFGSGTRAIFLFDTPVGRLESASIPFANILKTIVEAESASEEDIEYAENLIKHIEAGTWSQWVADSTKSVQELGLENLPEGASQQEAIATLNNISTEKLELLHKKIRNRRRFAIHMLSTRNSTQELTPTELDKLLSSTTIEGNQMTVGQLYMTTTENLLA